MSRARSPSRRQHAARRRVLCFIFGCAALSSTALAVRAERPEEASPPFGFRELEIYRIAANATSLRSTDVDGDGRRDLVYADNSEGTVVFLLQDGKGPKEKLERDSRNDLEDDRRFRREKFYTEKALTSLVVGDFNSDGKPDIAYHANPPEFEIVYQSTSWGAERKSFPDRDASKSAYALRAADLEGDGKEELLLLGRSKLYVFRQGEQGITQPTELPISAQDVAGLELADLDGDGRLDLLFMSPSRKRPVTVRLQDADGFGPEIPCELASLNAWFLGRPDWSGPQGAAGARDLLLTIEQGTRRLKTFQWRASAEDKELRLLGSPRYLAQRGEGDDKARRRLVADLDRDGRLDFIVSSFETAQLDVLFQNERGVHARRATYPTLAEVSGLVTGDVDGDGHEELLVTSRREKAIGLARWDGSRLPFPRTLSLPEAIAEDFDPLLLAVDAGMERPAALVLVHQKKDKEDKTSFALCRLALSEDASALELLSEQTIDLGGTAPSALRVFDADGDGRSDLLVFVPYTDPYLFLAAKSEPADAPSEQEKEPAVGKAEDDSAPNDAKTTPAAYEEISRRPQFGIGQLSGLEPSSLTVVEGAAGEPSLLLAASKQFVRALRLTETQQLEVVEQFSSERIGAQLTSSAVLDLDGEGDEEIVLYDQAGRRLDVLVRQEDGTYSSAESLEIPSMDLLRTITADLDGDGREDLVLIGQRRTAILSAGGSDPGFEELLSYVEEDRRDLGRPNDLTLGDFNHDGRTDIVVVTEPRYRFLFLERKVEEEKTLLERSAYFPIFEEKSYMRQATNLGPRQLLVDDLDGDGQDDLAVLIHDRLLLYLQDRLGPAIPTSQSTEGETR